MRDGVTINASSSPKKDMFMVMNQFVNIIHPPPSNYDFTWYSRVVNVMNQFAKLIHLFPIINYWEQFCYLYILALKHRWCSRSWLAKSICEGRAMTLTLCAILLKAGLPRVARNNLERLDNDLTSGGCLQMSSPIYSLVLKWSSDKDQFYWNHGIQAMQFVDPLIYKNCNDKQMNETVMS